MVKNLLIARKTCLGKVWAFLISKKKNNIYLFFSSFLNDRFHLDLVKILTPERCLIVGM